MAKKRGDKLPDRVLTRSEKAGILLNSLGNDATSNVMKNLRDNDIRRIMALMGKSKKVPVTVLKDIMVEFYRQISEEDEILLGADGNKDVLMQSIGEERAKLIFGSFATQPSQQKQLEALEMVDPRTLAQFLVNEHPQTVAVILAHLPPDKKTDTLKRLPEELQVEASMRMAGLDFISPDLLTHIDDILKTELAAMGSMEQTQVGGVEPVASMFNLLDKNTEQAIMSKIEEKDPLLAEEIRKLMFVFEDLVKVDDKGLGLILKEIQNDQLLKALKSAPDLLKEKIFRNMSRRAAQQLKEDLDVLGPQRLSEVEGAQQAMVGVARRLEEEGKIFIDRGGDGDGLV